jgi:hypothetical protein
MNLWGPFEELGYIPTYRTDPVQTWEDPHYLLSSIDKLEVP